MLDSRTNGRGWRMSSNLCLNELIKNLKVCREVLLLVEESGTRSELEKSTSSRDDN